MKSVFRAKEVLVYKISPMVNPDLINQSHLEIYNWDAQSCKYLNRETAAKSPCY